MEDTSTSQDYGFTNNGFKKDENDDLESNTVKTDTPVQSRKNEKSEMLYEINDSVPWPLAALLGLQHYLTMVGSLVAIPLIVTPLLCISEDDPVRGRFVSTIIFVSGMVTFLQTTFGVRLPIVQGGTFSFLVPTFTIIKTVFPPCEEMGLESMTEEQREEVWQVRIREIQGSIILACLFEVVVSATGLMGLMLKWITPLAITPTITLIGLSLFSTAAEKSSGNWAISIMTVILLILFSQYLVEWSPKLPSYEKGKGLRFQKYPLFKTFPILFGICTAWIITSILTVSGAFDETSPARTDLKYSLIKEAPWFVFPYPFQFGIPTISIAGVFGMISGAVASMIESVGDYYACARICGAPPPPVHAVNRGIFMEGFGGVLAGIWGTGNGTTSYSQNIGALRITKVANRRVIQAGGILMMACGIFGKFGAFCATIPDPLIGGLFTVMFSIITAVGLSNLQLVDLNSSRNLFVLGFSIFFGISFPKWVEENPEALTTGVAIIDQVSIVLFASPMFIGGFLGFFLDNTIPGTRKERGLDAWNQQMTMEGNADTGSVYDLPVGMNIIRKYNFMKHIPISPTYKR